MAKVPRLTFLKQRKEFFLKLGATFVVLFGLMSAALSLAKNSSHIATTIAVVSAIFFVAALIHLKKLIIPQVTVDDILDSDIDGDLHTILHCPCGVGLVEEAKKLASSCFVGTVSIAPDVYENLYIKNPNILVCLTRHNGEFLGYFDVIPLKDDFARSFMAGIVTENQISHANVLSPEQMHTCKYVFISGLAVRDPDAHAGRRSASILVWGLLKYLDHFYGSAKPAIFAVAARDAGEELLRRFKLKLSSRSTERTDKYNLYTGIVSRDQIGRRLACLPDWSKLSELGWTRKRSPTTQRKRKKQNRPLPPKNKAWKLSAEPRRIKKSR